MAKEPSDLQLPARPGDQRTFEALNDPKLMAKAVIAGTSTGGGAGDDASTRRAMRAMEDRRQKIEEDSIRMDAILDMIFNEKLSPQKQQQALLQLHVLSMCTIVHQLSFISDSLTMRLKLKGKAGDPERYRRLTLMDVADEMAAIISPLTDSEGENGEVERGAVTVIAEMGGFIASMLKVAGNNISAAAGLQPPVFHGPSLDENGVQRRDPKDGRPLYLDDIFVEEKNATISGTRRRLSEMFAQGSVEDGQVVDEAASERRISEAIAKDRAKIEGTSNG